MAGGDTQDLREQRNITKELLGILDLIGRKKKENVGSNKTEYDLLQKQEKGYKEILKVSEEIDNNLKNIGKSSFKNVDATKGLIIAENELKNLEDSKLKKAGKTYKTRKALWETQRDQAKNVIEENKGLEDQHKILEDQGATLSTSLNSIISGIPGGGLFLKLWDPKGKKLQDKAIGMIQKGMGQSGKSAKKFTGKLMGGLVAAGAAAGALGAMYSMIIKAGTQIGDETRRYQDSLGLSAGDAEKLVHQSRALAHETRVIGVLNADVVAAVTAVADVYDRIPDAQSVQVKNTLRLNKLFGVSVSEGALMQRMFEEMGQTSEEAFNTSVLAANLAKAANVPIGGVIKDIASNAGVASKYFKGNTVELFKSAINAKMLGLSLGDVGKIANKIMDIESSLQSEMQAQVILGRDMNFDAERRLVFEGKMDEALKGVIGKMGSIDKFNKMSFIEKEAAAEASGLEVSQIEKALQKKKLIGKMDEEQKARYKAAERALETQNTLTAEGLVQEEERNLLTQRYGAMWEDVKLQIMESLVPVAKDLLPAIIGLAQFMGQFFKIMSAIPGVMHVLIILATAVGIALMIGALAVSIMSFGAAAKVGGIAFAAVAAIGAGAMAFAPSTPDMHAGGVVKQTGDYTLQAGERVISRNQQTQAGGGTGTDTGKMESKLDKLIAVTEAKQTTTVKIDDKTLAEVVNKNNGVRAAVTPPQKSYNFLGHKMLLA